MYDCHSWQTLLPLQFIFMGAGMASAPDVPFRSLMLGLKMTLTKSKQTVQTLNAVFSPCFQTIVFSVELHNFIRVPIWIFKTVYQHWSPYKMKCPRTQLDHRGSPLEVHSWTLPPCHCANIQNLWKNFWKHEYHLILMDFYNPGYSLCIYCYYLVTSGRVYYWSTCHTVSSKCSRASFWIYYYIFFFLSKHFSSQEYLWTSPHIATQKGSVRLWNKNYDYFKKYDNKKGLVPHSSWSDSDGAILSALWHWKWRNLPLLLGWWHWDPATHWVSKPCLHCLTSLCSLQLPAKNIKAW